MFEIIMISNEQIIIHYKWQAVNDQCQVNSHLGWIFVNDLCWFRLTETAFKRLQPLKFKVLPCSAFPDHFTVINDY